ncbi:hypothetical protein OIU84_002481 [Salix udensis]|uniref:Uncharacterized protein n=1 Tax=Salix udensis TaxID=889485 RepID=A0AAD6K5S3_9ROSI|nr:hypothetical protein OIU84_002481 [Salix udensis]
MAREFLVHEGSVHSETVVEVDAMVGGAMLEVEVVVVEVEVEEVVVEVEVEETMLAAQILSGFKLALDKMWDADAAGPQPESGLGKLRKISTRPLHSFHLAVY